MFLTLTAILSALAASEPVDTSDPFPWAIHIFTIPLTLLVGVAIGWALRDRKAEMDEARAEMLAQEDAEAAKDQAEQAE